MARKSRNGGSAETALDAPALPPRDIGWTSSDGISLHARHYGDPISPWLPVVCLPGLSRTCRDFEDLAVHLSTHRHRPRRVVCFDYRGRGRSGYDRNTANYNPVTEMNDVLDGMALLGIRRAVVVGTSRGGIIAMLMGVARPAVLAGVVLNDIGPVIEPLGLARIKSYVGRMPRPDDWKDAANILRRLHGAAFNGLSDADWDAYARSTYRDENGQPVGDYDPALAETLAGVEFDKPMPDLWPQFRTFAHIPVMAIRGENSDILSEATFTAMAADHPGLEQVTVKGQGHAPILRQPQLLQRISAFVTAAEGAGPDPDAVIPRTPAPFDLDADES
jgi:pimeloyl-ACP methyl ester carboxylesterase